MILVPISYKLGINFFSVPSLLTCYFVLDLLVSTRSGSESLVQLIITLCYSRILIPGRIFVILG